MFSLVQIWALIDKCFLCFLGAKYWFRHQSEECQNMNAASVFWRLTDLVGATCQLFLVRFLEFCGGVCHSRYAYCNSASLQGCNRGRVGENNENLFWIRIALMLCTPESALYLCSSWNNMEGEVMDSCRIPLLKATLKCLSCFVEH